MTSYNSKLPLTKIRHIGLLPKNQSPKVKLVAIKTSHEQKCADNNLLWALVKGLKNINKLIQKIKSICQPDKKYSIFELTAFSFFFKHFFLAQAAPAGFFEQKITGGRHPDDDKRYTIGKYAWHSYNFFTLLL